MRLLLLTPSDTRTQESIVHKQVLESLSRTAHSPRAPAAPPRAFFRSDADRFDWRPPPSVCTCEVHTEIAVWATRKSDVSSPQIRATHTGLFIEQHLRIAGRTTPS